MNKAEAMQFAKRLLAGFIEEHFNGASGNKVDPLVYDDLCPSQVEGRRLSEPDHDRVCNAMEALREKLDKESCTEAQSFERNSGRHFKPDGKPGSRWKGYHDWLKRQGRTS